MSVFLLFNPLNLSRSHPPHRNGCGIRLECGTFGCRSEPSPARGRRSGTSRGRSSPPSPVSAGVGKPGMDSEWASGCTGSTARATDGRPPEESNRTSHPGALLTQPKHVQAHRGSECARARGPAKGKQPNTEALCQTPRPPHAASLLRLQSSGLRGPCGPRK